MSRYCTKTKDGIETQCFLYKIEPSDFVNNQNILDGVNQNKIQYMNYNSNVYLQLT